MIAFIGHDDTTDAHSVGLTDEQVQRFEEHGYVKLSGAFNRKNALEMETYIWDCLAKLRGILEKDKSTWSIPGPWVGLNKFKREAVFAPVYRGRFRVACDQLFGQHNWTKPASSGGFLVTFPDCDCEQWDVPRKAWHVDAHFTFDPEQLFGVRIFNARSQQ